MGITGTKLEIPKIVSKPLRALGENSWSVTGDGHLLQNFFGGIFVLYFFLNNPYIL